MEIYYDSPYQRHPAKTSETLKRLRGSANCDRDSPATKRLCFFFPNIKKVSLKGAHPSQKFLTELTCSGISSFNLIASKLLLQPKPSKCGPSSLSIVAAICNGDGFTFCGFHICNRYPGDSERSGVVGGR